MVLWYISMSNMDTDPTQLCADTDDYYQTLDPVDEANFNSLHEYRDSVERYNQVVDGADDYDSIREMLNWLELRNDSKKRVA